MKMMSIGNRAVEIPQFDAGGSGRFISCARAEASAIMKNAYDIACHTDAGTDFCDCLRKAIFAMAQEVLYGIEENYAPAVRKFKVDTETIIRDTKIVDAHNESEAAEKAVSSLGEYGDEQKAVKVEEVK